MWRNSPVSFIKNYRPLVMAHRGDSANVPENTSLAFEEAVRLNVDVIETDVHITSDNQLVFFHDKTLDRTTDGAGKITEKTLEELKQLDLGYRFDPNGNKEFPYRGKGLQIQTVEEILERFPNMRFNMDIKDKEYDAPYELANLLKKLDAQHRVQVGSFHQKQIDQFRLLSKAPTSAGPFDTMRFLRKAKKWLKKNPDIAGKSQEEIDKMNITQEKVFGRKLPFVSLTIPMGIPMSSFNPFWKYISKENVIIAHILGIAVFVWTINEEHQMKTLIKWGIDGIFTDKPGLMIKVLNSMEFN